MGAAARLQHAAGARAADRGALPGATGRDPRRVRVVPAGAGDRRGRRDALTRGPLARFRSPLESLRSLKGGQIVAIVAAVLIAIFIFLRLLARLYVNVLWFES